MISEMNFFERIVYILQNYGISYLKGAGTTLLIALVSTAIGCVIGFAVGIVQTIPVDKKRDGIGKRLLLGLVKVILKAYVEIFRGTPMIVQAVFIYFGLSQMCNIQLGMWQAAFLVVSINTGAYMAESVRGGIISVDPGQMEAGRSLGFNYAQTMWYVIMPQAFKTVLPTLCNEFISLLKETSVSGYIAIQDLTKGGDIIRSRTYSAFMPLIAVALVYLVIVMIFTKLIQILERRLRQSER
jgi:His/Glu/Gln/Arg/opine family amino acid ABC transporter permease subunit